MSKIKTMAVVAAITVVVAGLIVLVTPRGNAATSCLTYDRTVPYRTSNWSTASTWMYGDSITVQTGRAIKAKVGRSIAIDAKSGRTTWEGVDVLANDLKRTKHRPKTLVMALGTNDMHRPGGPGLSVAEQIQRVHRLLPHVRLIWVDTFNTPHDGWSSWRVMNKTIEDAPGRRLWWAATVRDNPSKYLVDGIHVNQNGCRARVALVSNAL